jgi:hypothetical protein
MRVAPTDVTDPPDGWEWAKQEVMEHHLAHKRRLYVVSQQMPKGTRYVNALDKQEAQILMRQWNDEAKQG